MKYLVLLLLIFTPIGGWAFGTIAIENHNKNRAGLWLEETQLLANKPPQTHVWLHAGDSLAVAWGNRTQLSLKLIQARSANLPDPNSLEEKFSHRTEASLTWYAGSKVNGGLLEWLEQKQSWIMLSSALVGARLAPTVKPTHHTLSVLKQIQHKEKVRLITLSLGANDLCQDPKALIDRQNEWKNELLELKKLFPNSVWAVWAPPKIEAMYSHILQNIDQATATDLALQRLRQYCQRSWLEVNCPSLKQAQLNPEAQRILNIAEQKLRHSFREIFGSLLEMSPQDLPRESFLNNFSGDCFHPSQHMQDLIRLKLQSFLLEHFPGVLDR